VVEALVLILGLEMAAQAVAVELLLEQELLGKVITVA
jgi:hypothetical protein